jgi:hypothetical protein
VRASACAAVDVHPYIAAPQANRFLFLYVSPGSQQPYLMPARSLSLDRWERGRTAAGTGVRVWRETVLNDRFKHSKPVINLATLEAPPCDAEAYCARPFEIVKNRAWRLGGNWRFSSAPGGKKIFGGARSQVDHFVSRCRVCFTGLASARLSGVL